jgi:hypothetical protein
MISEGVSDVAGTSHAGPRGSERIADGATEADRIAISNLFELPCEEAAKRMGMCNTLFKKHCRKNGIKRWPYRKINSLNRIKSIYKVSEPEIDKEIERIKKDPNSKINIDDLCKKK